MTPMDSARTAIRALQEIADISDYPIPVQEPYGDHDPEELAELILVVRESISEHIDMVDWTEEQETMLMENMDVVGSALADLVAQDDMLSEWNSFGDDLDGL